jgi:hypothetical protein
MLVIVRTENKNNEVEYGFDLWHGGLKIPKQQEVSKFQNLVKIEEPW